MPLYNYRQLVIVSITGFALFFIFTKKLFITGRHMETGIQQKAGYVYELRGNIKNPGFYCFETEQSLQGLKQAAGGETTAITGYNIPHGNYIHANAVKIDFSNPLSIEDIGACAKLNFFMPLDLNAAEKKDLLLIPGIGEKTACAIINYRENIGKIHNINNLTAIRGMGRKKLKILKKYLKAD